MDAAGVLRYAAILGQLKRTLRTGWVENGVHRPESVADHSFRMAMLAFGLIGTTVDWTKCVKMALVHDLAEAIVGDIIADRPNGPTKAQKKQLERDAFAVIDQDTSATELLALYEEYEAGQTLEAKTVKDLDLFDMEVQAYEYAQLQPELDLGSFFKSTSDDRYQTDTIRAWHQAFRAKMSEKSIQSSN